MRHGRRVVVVGAGIAGLGAAWHLTQHGGGDLEVVVLESSGRVGGALAPVTLTVPADAGAPGVELVLDGGAESLLARRTEAVGLAVDVGLSADLVTPAAVRALVLSRGALHRLPAGTLMGVPASAQGLEGLLTPQEVERFRAETLTDAVPGPGADVDVASWVGARLGAAVVDRIVDPLLGGVYAGSAAGLSLRAALPALWPAVRDGTSATAGVAAATAAAGAGVRAGVAGGAVGAAGAVGESVFAGISGGVWRLAPTLAAVLPRTGGAVRLGSPVTRLEAPTGEGGRWRVHVGGDSGDLVEADAVVMAVPPHVAAPLLAGIAPAAADGLRAVPSASLALVTAVLPAGTLTGAEGLGGLSGVLVPPVEGRVVKAMTFSSQKWAWVREAAGGRDVVRCSVGRHGEAAVLAHDDADLADLALQDASTLLGVELAPVASAVTRWTSALPQYAPGHVQRVAAVRAAAAGVPGLALAGAVFDGVGVPASIASARRAAAEVLADLQPLPG